MRITPIITAALLMASSSAVAAQVRSAAIPITYSQNYDPSLSPDGKRMVFLKAFEGRETLFIANSDGHAEKQLLQIDGDIEDPAWSPDGLQVAYVRIEGGKKSLHVMNIDGSGDRRITPQAQSPIHPEWTPDGKALLYCTDDDLDPPRKNAAEIYRLDVASGQITTVLSGGVNTYPVESPDGRRIAFRKFADNNSEVFVMDADGQKVRNLTNHPAFDGWPAWSPDSKRIAFASNRNSAYQIFVMDADGGNVKLVANTEGRATAPKWSPDGRTIYFTNCWRTGIAGACEIFAAAAPSP